MNAKDIVEALTPLANKLGQGAEEVYKAYYRQSIINGIEELLWVILLVGLIVFVAHKFLRPMYTHYKEDSYNDGIALGLSVIGLVILLVLAMFSLTDAITSFANPQYQAINSIIGAAKR